MKTIAPKQQFIASPEAAQFADSLGQPIVRKAIEVALSQFMMDQIPTGDLTAAAVANIALEGAKRYAHILLNLTDPGEQRPLETPGLEFKRAGKTPPAKRAIVRPGTPPPKP